MKRLPTKMKAPSGNRGRNAGVGLIEVLIAVAILAFGMLGIAALQATALRNGQSSYERSQAVTLTYSILDRMRTNLDEARTAGYNMAMTCEDPVATNPQAEKDLIAWLDGLHDTLGSQACGAIACVDGSASSPPIPPQKCDITIQWDDSRGTSGKSSQTLTTSTAI